MKPLNVLCFLLGLSLAFVPLSYATNPEVCVHATYGSDGPIWAVRTTLTEYGFTAGSYSYSCFISGSYNP